MEQINYPEFKIIEGSLEDRKPIYVWLQGLFSKEDKDKLQRIADILLEIGYEEGLDAGTKLCDTESPLDEKLEIHRTLNPKI